MGSGRGPGRNGGPMMHELRESALLGGTGSALDHGGVAGFKGLRPGQGRATQAAHFLGFPPKTPKMTTSGPNPGSRAQSLGLGQMRSFSTSGPNPWFWAQNHGFGPDVVIVSLKPPGASQKQYKTHEKTGETEPQ